MADVYEKNLEQKASLTVNDYIRVVGSDNVSYKQLVSDVANKIITTYSGATLAGSAQSVKSAIDSLNSNINGLYTCGRYSINLASATPYQLIDDRKIDFSITFSVKPMIFISVGTDLANAKSQEIGYAWYDVTTSSVRIRLRSLTTIDSSVTIYVDWVAIKRK